MARLIPQIVGFLLFFVFSLFLAGAFSTSLMAPIMDFPRLVTQSYFDLQGLVLTVGRLDVPCESLNWEAFRVDGKCYGYWGLVPSFFRLILNGLCLSCFGHWSRLMMVMGGSLSFVALLLIARLPLRDHPESWAKSCWQAGFALILSLGGTLVFIVSNPYGYHEAILWADAFCLLALWALARHAESGEPWAARLALTAILFALHSRVTVGVGAAGAGFLAFMAPLVADHSALARFYSANAVTQSRRRALTWLITLLLMLPTPFLVEYLKFGQIEPPFETQKFFQDHPQRLERISQGNFQLKNFACDARIYLSPDMIRFQGNFPWIEPPFAEYWFAGSPLPEIIQDECGRAGVEHLDPTFGLPDSNPAAVLLGLVGALLLVTTRRSGIWREWWPLIAGAGAAGGGLLFFSSVTYRYVLDFLPILAISSAVAWGRIAGLRSVPHKILCLSVLAPLALAGLTVNLAAAWSSGSPQPYVLIWRHAFYAFFQMLGLA